MEAIRINNCGNGNFHSKSNETLLMTGLVKKGRYCEKKKHMNARTKYD